LVVLPVPGERLLAVVVEEEEEVVGGGGEMAILAKSPPPPCCLCRPALFKAAPSTKSCRSCHSLKRFSAARIAAKSEGCPAPVAPWAALLSKVTPLPGGDVLEEEEEEEESKALGEPPRPTATPLGSSVTPFSMVCSAAMASLAVFPRGEDMEEKEG
jgi:hypothetical protein